MEQEQYSFNSPVSRTTWVTTSQHQKGKPPDGGMAVASPGLYASHLHLVSGWQLITHLQAGCFSWHPTNSVRALLLPAAWSHNSNVIYQVPTVLLTWGQIAICSPHRIILSTCISRPLSNTWFLGPTRIHVPDAAHQFLQDSRSWLTDRPCCCVDHNSRHLGCSCNAA